MRLSLLQPLLLRLDHWIASRRGVEHGEVLLDRKRVYILPTRAGLVFGVAALVLLVGSINYQLQLGFLLTFLVASMALVGMHHTHRNLARVTLASRPSSPVFAGDLALFEIQIANATAEPRYALWVEPMQRGRRGGAQATANALDLPASSARIARIGVPAPQRGRLACPRLRIATRFPLGLFEAWAHFSPALSLVVYPKPEDDAPPLPAAGGAGREGGSGTGSGDDFAGVRPYQAGDPQKMIAWRLAARSDELSVKLFEAAAGTELLLDFDALPRTLDTEARLSRLARWVLAAEALHLRYGLRLPGLTIAPDSGAEQHDRCLTALALYRGAPERKP